MSSTNKTTNYQLSQFIGSDKPAWLGDYNQDMSKIDAGMKTAADTATAASGAANNANTAIGTLSDLTTSNKTDLVSAVNEVNLGVNTAQQTANTAGNIANTANTKADNLAAQFDLSIIKNDSDLTFTTSAGTFNGHNVKIARNADSSLCKIYGTFGLNGTAGTGDLTVTIRGTGINVPNPITINDHAISTSTIYQLNQGAGYAFTAHSITIDNDTVTLTFTRSSKIDQRLFIMFNSLLILKDFGDIVTPDPQP